MILDCHNNEIRIGDKVLFIRRKYGICLVEGYIRKINSESVVITETEHTPLKNCLTYLIMNPQCSIKRL